jgi:hypothetical protein
MPSAVATSTTSFSVRSTALVTTPELDLLAETCLDLYLLARCAWRQDALIDGRAWERVNADVIARPGMARVQSAGLTTLVDRISASGCEHEIDASAWGRVACLIVESKARRSGIHKSDVATFDCKIFDYYCGNLEAAREERWWKLMASAAPVSEGVRRLGLQNNVVICEPNLLPLPVVLRAASRPTADMYLRGPLLQEMVRLGERTCSPMQERWQIQESGELLFRPVIWSGGELDDLLWLQEELTGDLLDLYDVHAPARLERRELELWLRTRADSYV